MPVRQFQDEGTFQIGAVSPRFHAPASRPASRRLPGKWWGLFIRPQVQRAQVQPPIVRPTVAVLPFVNLERSARGPSYGIALADAISARLSQAGSLVVLSGNLQGESFEQTGQRLGADRLVKGSFLRTERGFTISWQLLQVSPPALISGGTIALNSFDLVNLRKNICESLLTSLQAPQMVEPPRARR